MDKKTINGMHKAELLQLIQKTITQINRIDDAANKSDELNTLYDNIDSKNNKINSLYNKIFNDDEQESIDTQIANFLETAKTSNRDIDNAKNSVLDKNDGHLIQIEQAHAEVSNKVEVIQKTHKEICEGDEEKSSIQEQLNRLVNDFTQRYETIEKAHSDIFKTEDDDDDENGILEKIKQAKEEANAKLQKINNFYSGIFEDNEEKESIENKLNNFVDEFKEHNDDFKKLHNDIFGYEETIDGEEVKHPGEINRTKEIFKTYAQRYKILFDHIEDLLSGATTVSLSNNFNDKVNEYKKERQKWEKALVWFLPTIAIVTIILAILSVSWGIPKSTVYILGTPIYTFVIWFTVFLGNRRAENRKLEESFTHKVVMAKSFVGYQKSIEEIGKKLETDDYRLMETHMRNLLDAISKDSSLFFEIKGESHPILDFLRKKKNTKDN